MNHKEIRLNLFINNFYAFSLVRLSLFTYCYVVIISPFGMNDISNMGELTLAFTFVLSAYGVVIFSLIDLYYILENTILRIQGNTVDKVKYKVILVSMSMSLLIYFLPKGNTEIYDKVIFRNELTYAFYPFALYIFFSSTLMFLTSFILKPAFLFIESRRKSKDTEESKNIIIEKNKIRQKEKERSYIKATKYINEKIRIRRATHVNKKNVEQKQEEYSKDAEESGWLLSVFYKSSIGVASSLIVFYITTTLGVSGSLAVFSMTIPMVISLGMP